MAAAPPPSAPDAQERPWSLDLTIHDVGLGIGNSRHIDGLRLNAWDSAPFTVHGINVTLWSPTENGRGTVDGVALGLPVTGATSIRGLALGLFGFGAAEEVDGVGLAVLGGGTGKGLRGVFAGGLGFGTGGDIDGLAVAGLGIGCGGNVRGALAGGLGAGCGGNLTGAALGGLGVGVGGHVTGLLVGGLGAGAGEGIDGIAIGGLGIGTGGDLRGIAVGGLGIGAGGAIEGVAVAGLGVGAPAVHGFVAALASGARDFAGLAIAPAYFHVEPGGSMTGLSVSAFNRIRGEQHGVAIGIVNYTPSLHGLQLGLVNWAGNNASGLKLLPIANAHFD